MNYHNLADFRTDHCDTLERLLAEGVAALVAEGLVALEVLAQDGLRVRAAAGAGSFRRRPSLEKLAEAAQNRVARLRQEAQNDPAGSDRRRQAAQQRAAREQQYRVKAALDRIKELEAERDRRAKTNKAQVEKQKEPRASTTDREARSVKMADGGFRPAYNLQIVCEPQSQVVVAVDVDTTGSDHGMARRGLEQLAAGDVRPVDYLVDGGFAKHEDIEWAHQAGIRLWCPAMKNKHGTNPYALRPRDGPGVADWRRRMAGERGRIVVTGYEMLVPAEPSKQLGDYLRALANGEIAEMPDHVVRPDRLVPPFDQRLVHRRDRGEGPPVESQGAAMAEMRVAGEEDRHPAQGWIRRARCRSRGNRRPCTTGVCRARGSTHRQSSRPC